MVTGYMLVSDGHAWYDGEGEDDFTGLWIGRWFRHIETTT
jgi:hypothetical protein